MKKTTFEDLNLSTNLKKAVTDMGFVEATPIQAEAIPVLLKGRDIIGQARTGSGKTAAFAMPIIERIDITSKALQALVICPTRELAIQVTEEFRKLFKYYYGLSVATVYGGQEMGRQIAALLKKPQIIVGTPGRLMDHMRRRTVCLDTIKFVVLDEADKMLDMGFRNDMETILGQTPKTRQTAMFSATMDREIMRLMNRYQNNPVHIDTTKQKMDVPKIEQTYYDMHEMDKPEALTSIIDQHNLKVALVFSNTKSKVDRIVKKLNNNGYTAAGIHGGHDQRQRERAMNSFRTGAVGILVATDVAGRGIDVSGIEAVINYDFPMDDENYIHRIGRTGRAGKTGKAFTFVVGSQLYDIMRVGRESGLDIKRMSIPGAGLSARRIQQ
ncbi:MAG TPA: RNA helicase [Candidatus Wallbacteria bacterium]|nr:RNA helicase [Candidatus Wallbacteria bacterium]